MLPFLQPKRSTAVIIAKRTPAHQTETIKEEGEADPGLMAAAEALISAVHNKDSNGVCKALEDAFACLDGADYDEPSEVES